MKPETNPDAHTPAGPGDVRVIVVGQDVGGVPVPWRTPRSGSSRTRFLTFLSERGAVTKAPAVRTYQLALMLGMGADWLNAALRMPKPVMQLDGPGKMVPGDTYLYNGLEFSSVGAR